MFNHRSPLFRRDRSRRSRFHMSLNSTTNLVIAEGLARVLHVRQRHPQGFQLGAAGQQLSLQLVPQRLDSLRLRLQAGQLHWDARRNTFEEKNILFVDDFFSQRELKGVQPFTSTQTRGEMDFASPSKTSGDGRWRQEGETERRRFSVRKLRRSEILPPSASQQPTHRSPPSGCPAAPSGGRSRCGGAPRSAPPAAQTMTGKRQQTNN